MSWPTTVIDSVHTSTAAVSKMAELETNPLPENQRKKSSSLSTFARHYKVLMWKNFVLRRRRPVFLAAELLVPIIFPVILIVIRSRAIDVKESTCYAQSISMPSMGLLTYVQSMLCNFQYRCQTTDPSRFKSIVDHKELVDALHEISLLVQDPWISQVLSTAIASKTDNLSIPNSQTVEKLQRVVQAVSNIMNGQSNIWQPSSPDDESQTVHLFGFNVSLATLNRIGNLSSTICSSPPEKNDIGQIVIWMKSLATNTKNIQTVFPMSVRSSSPSNLVRHRRSVKPTPRTIRTKPARTLCTELKHFLTISKIHKYTERLLFFLFGMVYYYPATSYTNEIMHRAAAPRRMLKRVHAVVKHYLDHTSPGLHRLLDSEMITETVQTLSRICDTLASASDSQTVNQFCQMISPVLNNSIAHIKFLNQIDEGMLLFHEILSCSEPYVHLLPVQSEKEFQSLLVFFQQSTFPSAIGVNFSLVPSVNMTDSRTPLGSAVQFFEVILRKIETTHQFRVFDRLWTPSPRQNPLSGDMNYLTGGFLDVQESISEAIIDLVSGRPDRLERTANVPSLYSDLVSGTELKLIPTPCYLNRGFIGTFARILPQFLLFIWVFTAMLSTKYIVEEKEQHLKEFTRIMGLSTTIHWFGWFTITAVIMMVSVLAITFVLKFGNLIPGANYIMLLCFFLSYIVAVIALVFLCSTFFTQANLGAVVTGMVYFILFLPTPFLLTNEAVLTEAAVFGACLSCQVAFTMGLYYFMRIETQGFGAQWPDFWQTRHSNDVFSIGKCMVMLWVDTLIYMFFTWYIDAVHPGKYAVGRPLCFLFTREYWLGTISASTASLAGVCAINQECDVEGQQDPRYFEREIDRQLSIGVGVFKITKRYKKKDKLALDQLTINFYANQITSLLGHNGAGKSTLISILTGMQAPTSGWARIWFDNKGYVSAPAYLNMLQNMQLRMLLANGTSSDTLETQRPAGIAIVNHPVELPPYVAITRSSRTLMLDVTLAIFTILALSFIPASLITFLVMERHTGSKHLQFASGLNAYVYWISVYLWDIMNYLIPAGLCILVFVAFQKYAYVGTDTIGPFILLIFFYGLAVLPMLYPFSFVIRSPSTALVVLAIVNVLLGALSVTVTFFFDILSQDDPALTPANNVLKLFFLVLPQYCLGRGLYDLAFREFILRFRDTIFVDVTVYENPLKWGLLGRKLCALGLQTVVFLVFVLCIENQFFKGPIKTYFHKRYPRLAKRRLIKLQKKVTKMASDHLLVANDVQFEQRRVFELQETNSLPSSSSVSTLRLTKFFRRKKIPSVNQLTFAIHPAECFGLLGVNGAGKTTTFHMLTGSLRPTFGVAYVNGYNVMDQQRQAHRSLGFCPQFDAVLDLLTGRETLTLYARLRGVPEQRIPQTVTTLLTDMGLAPHADKVAGAYSGGNRRKLSTAIAILGDPQVIFLDEPTSGMDPLAKRFLWDQIIRLIKSGKSVLLTSHSMEECEALCDRLGIMVNGQFRCLGSVQQLKNRFGNGYTVELRISELPEAADQVRRTLQNEFPQLSISNTQTKCYEYQFPQRMQLANLFETLNRLRTGGLIEQYSVKQTTLDQVFVNFSQMQMGHLEVSDEDTSILTRVDGNAESLTVPSTTSIRQRCIDGVTNSSYEPEF
ncbi:hypothetical protein PHET_05572 [Paragonimus heterotremus]|uniref:ABC transporter domain-containing protein n=1 Tax=Paragonimus heterotremus TaxID=100268 RepID=A0A8J4TGH0_9TREM|nr:hypothetical protein PHET_05572 [Paragonimus heterotremus]